MLSIENPIANLHKLYNCRNAQFLSVAAAHVTICCLCFFKATLEANVELKQVHIFLIFTGIAQKRLPVLV